MSPQFLTGSYDHSLDDRNRVIIPAAFRTALGQKFYLTKSLSSSDKCLNLYPEGEYAKLVNQLESRIPKRDKQGQWALRDFYRYAVEVEIDVQNRITISQLHRDFAGIGACNKRVVFLGRVEYAELWDADSFEEQQRASEGDLTDYLGE